jgi:hypothetical protein
MPSITLSDITSGTAITLSRTFGEHYAKPVLGSILKSDRTASQLLVVGGDAPLYEVAIQAFATNPQKEWLERVKASQDIALIGGASAQIVFEDRLNYYPEAVSDLYTRSVIDTPVASGDSTASYLAYSVQITQLDVTPKGSDWAIALTLLEVP